MAQKTPGAPEPIRNDNNLYGQNICPMGKKSFQEVAESFSNQNLPLLKCDWEQSAKIILMSRVNVSAQRFGSARFRKSVETWV